MDDETRFGALWDAHRDAVCWAYAARRVGPDRAADVVHETFLVAWRRLDDVPAAAAPWLIAVARHTILHERRGTARRAQLDERLAGLAERSHDEPPPAIDPDLMRAARQLPLADRELLALIAWDGLTVGRGGSRARVAPRHCPRPSPPRPHPLAALLADPDPTVAPSVRVTGSGGLPMTDVPIRLAALDPLRAGRAARARSDRRRDPVDAALGRAAPCPPPRASAAGARRPPRRHGQRRCRRRGRLGCDPPRLRRRPSQPRPVVDVPAMQQEAQAVHAAVTDPPGLTDSTGRPEPGGDVGGGELGAGASQQLTLQMCTWQRALLTAHAAGDGRRRAARPRGAVGRLLVPLLRDDDGRAAVRSTNTDPARLADLQQSWDVNCSGRRLRPRTHPNAPPIGR